MHLNHINYETEFQLVAADGTVYWRGLVIFGLALQGLSAEASTVISPGQAVKIDAATTTFGRDAKVASDAADLLQIGIKQIAAATDVAVIGVAAQRIAPIVATTPGTGRGLVAGPSSMCSVAVTSGAIAAGFPIRGSGTAGLCQAAAAKDASNPVYGTVLGTCIKAAAQINSEGTYTAGVVVLPY